MGHRRTSSLGKYGRHNPSSLEEGEGLLEDESSIDYRNKKLNMFNQPFLGSKKRHQSTLIKKICFSSIFACHPRRMLRIKSNCRFLLLAILTLSTLMMLFTVTDFEHPNTPVIEDTINEAKEQIENVKKNLHEGNLLVRKRNGEEKLRVDKKYLISLGLPVYKDDVQIEVYKHSTL